MTRTLPSTKAFCDSSVGTTCAKAGLGAATAFEAVRISSHIRVARSLDRRTHISVAIRRSSLTVVVMTAALRHRRQRGQGIVLDLPRAISGIELGLAGDHTKFARACLAPSVGTVRTRKPSRKFFGR